MADVIRKSTNRFTKGLVMDFSPENTKNEVLTHALNATLLTFNGNELSLQNDMGNARVETAYLPEGYMPVGTCEYGGIIYIVSYNPLEDKSQIGCFPSPERNVSSNELGRPKELISRNSFQKPDAETGGLTGDIINTSTYVLLKNDSLNPGDKFLICTNPDIYNERLSDLWVEETGNFELISNPVIALNVVSIEDSGKIIYLNSDIKQYTVPIGDVNYKYHLLGTMGLDDSGNYEQATVDPDSYRNVLNSGYSVFKSKTSGRLAILAELIMIDSYSVTHSVVPKKDDSGDIVEGSFDVVIHTDITPRVTSENFALVPKLQYYYLQNSQGFIQVMKPTNVGDSGGYLQLSDDSWVKPMYTYDENGNVTTIRSDSFFGTSLSEIYTPTTDDISLKGNLRKTSQFNFPKPYSYHGRMQKYEGSIEDAGVNSVYTKFTEGKYHRIKGSQVVDNFQNYYIDEVQAKFYRYVGKSEQYTPVTEDMELDNIYEYYIKTYTPFYYDAQRDEKYQNAFLYKMISPPQVATDSVLSNTSIEKFKSQTTTTYREATEEDKEDISKLLEKVGNSYSEVILQPGESLDPNKTYYVAEVTTVLVSIGTGVINRDEVEGEIYYYPATKEFIPATDEELEAYWDFDTNPYNANHPFYGYKETFYWSESKESYEKATEDEILNYKEYGMELFYQSDYMYIDPNNFEVFLEEQESSQQLFITVPMDTYVIYDKFVPNSTWNYIEGYEKPTGTNEPTDGFRDEGIISLYTVADFIPNNLSDDVSALQYEDLRLANIKIPSVVSVNGLDLPFKYLYTLVPCMNYGRLDHLAVSNTVDFSKLHAFNQSNFTTWKYHIDGDQLRLTFGADIFDTYETDKVDGLVLEFYDSWGFAGSLEITDKKSYSGIFTKIIPLNSRGALSLNRILGSGYLTSFKRNINIVLKRDEYGNKKDPEEFTFNGKDVTFGGYSQGWHYSDGTILSDEDNDCGTLYSNILYGVKTYLKVTKFKGTPEAYNNFIPKREFFLYTLPIYNDYFYSVNDFSTLTNPKLDLVLTYKLQDSGTKVPYTGNGITNGYYEIDQTNISKYLNGTYDRGTTLNVTKYYKYSGTSNLYLEVGLKQDYQDLNISYDASINDIFTCNLSLIGDSSNSTFDVKYSDNTSTSSEQVLEYYHNSDNPLNLSVNSLGFGNIPGDGVFDNSIVKTIGQCNFIARQGTAPIPINYEFIVGYQANITNITSTEIPATTVCALCHADENGVYNYEDFGVYESDGQFLSNAMFYNGGTSETEEFGVCRQIQTDSGLAMVQQCRIIDTIKTEAQESKLPRILNSGDPLKHMRVHIGKLTFCQPHAHGMSENNSVNIYPCNNGELGISQDNVGTIKVPGLSTNINDDSHGIVPDDYLLNNPKYNLSLNTKNCLEYYSEFVSTIEYDTATGKLKGYDHAGGDGPGWTPDDCTMLEYTGFDSKEISIFNKKMIETMKYVYAYNPDYDSLSVMVGDVSTQDRQVQFTSNLISSNSVLNFGDKTFNDYVYIGSISFSDYLKHLNICSEDSRGKKITVSHIVEEDNIKKELPLPQLQFTAGLDYCGGPESNYLVTSLNYNTPVPIELEEELSFKASNNLIVQHENGEREFIKGTPSKKALYGFDKTLKKLIQLDVSNYQIDYDGKLTLNNETVEGEYSTYQNLSGENLKRTIGGITYSFPINFYVDGEYEEEVYLTLTSNLYTNIINGSANKLYIALPGSPGYGNSISVSSYIRANSNKNYSYRVTINSIEVECNGKLLNPNKISISGSTGSKPNLLTQNVDTLQALVSNTGSNVTLIGTTGTSISGYNTDFWETSTGGGNVYKTNNSTTQPGFKFSTYGVNAIELYEVTLKKINFTITRYSVIADNPDSIIKVLRTNLYSKISNHEYLVLPEYTSTRFRGTSLTINDLEYNGLSTGHRLFIRNNLCVNDDIEYRNILYYRSLTDKSSWVKDSTQYRNHLYLQTGPCFTKSNLGL